MHVLIVGAAGKIGSIVPEHLGDDPEYEFTYLDTEPADYVTDVVDARDYAALRPHFDGVDAVINLAIVPGNADGKNWPVHLDNIRVTWNVYRAAWDAGVETVVYASTNHVVGMYELDNAPDIYEYDADIVVDHTVAPRPDSLYAVGKLYGEGLGRYVVEDDGPPHSVSALRIGTVREPPYDNPYGYPEQRVEAGAFDRDSQEYETLLKRSKALWHSRRDLAHMFECCLTNPPDGFEVFYGVSANERRWLDIDHARETIGYEPRDNGEEWTELPAALRDR
jgi:nucleoside-diphosphate-sugar epimerase